jgi:hypothetical protein
MLNHEAIYRAYPAAKMIDDGTGAFDADGNQIELDQSLVDAAAAEIAAERAATKYQRQRAPEYPSLQEFVDAYYWAQKGDNTLMDAYEAACDKVKADYPKP